MHQALATDSAYGDPEVIAREVLEGASKGLVALLASGDMTIKKYVRGRVVGMGETEEDLRVLRALRELVEEKLERGKRRAEKGKMPMTSGKDEDVVMEDRDGDGDGGVVKMEML